jgi:hypothetical protein
MNDVLAKASLTIALREPVNWLNLLIPSLSVLAGVSRLMLAGSGQDAWLTLLGLALTMGRLLSALYGQHFV